MSKLRWTIEAVHALALGLWLGCVLMTGVAAALIFPGTKALDPQLPAYAAYDGEHWRIVAGTIANQIFLYSDLIQFACAAVAGTTVLLAALALGSNWKRISFGARPPLVFGALSVFAYGFFILRTEMNEHLTMYWLAAEAGENDAAETARLAFAELHPTASALLGATCVLVAAAVVFQVFSLKPATTAETRPSDPVEPELAKGPRR